MTTTGLRRTLILAVLVVATAGPLHAQSVRVTVPEENFRKEPQATSANRLATVLEGTILAVQERRGRWVLGTLEGWIWSASVESTDRDGFDLVVTRTGGENLRRSADAEAARAAVLMQGMLLDSLGVQGDWIRVRRAAWVWAASTSETDEGPPTAIAAADSSPAPRPLPERLVVGSSGTGLLVSPEGDTAAVLGPGTDMEVLARQGGWTRVRLEGWVWEPSTMAPDSAGAAGFSVADLRNNPEQFRGRRVEWTLRYVALQRAEAVRKDFYEGEPYFLASPPSRTRELVYVAVPPELVPAVEALAPLQTVDVVARVRTGRSQTGVPILDLIALR